jgi:hypothetical protein
MNNDPEFFCDEELALIEWLRNPENKLTTAEIKDHERLIRYCFMQGFASGFAHQHCIKAEEMLQK